MTEKKAPVKKTTPGVWEKFATEFGVPAHAIKNELKQIGLTVSSRPNKEQTAFFHEVLSCKHGEVSAYKSEDKQVLTVLDQQIRGFDEVYVDTAPIIQQDWFLRFVADVSPVLLRRKKALVILEKTMEELYGLKDNPAKDFEVRIRSQVRPALIRHLASKHLVRIEDTGSRGIADDHLVDLFSRKQMKESLLLITQDRGLSERIVRLGEDSQDAHHKMVACKVDEQGSLRRCYICRECGESFYDEMVEGSGSRVCNRCSRKIQLRQAQKDKLAKQLAAKQKKQQEARAREVAIERRGRTVGEMIKNKGNRRKKTVLLISGAALILFSAILLIML